MRSNAARADELLPDEVMTGDGTEPKQTEAPTQGVKREDWFYAPFYSTYILVRDGEDVIEGKVETVCTYSRPGAKRPRQMDAAKLRPFLPETVWDLRAKAGVWGGAGAGINSSTALRLPVVPPHAPPFQS